MLNTFFEKCAFFLDNVENHCTARLATYDRTAHAHSVLDT
jgi:hypothetical protein